MALSGPWKPAAVGLPVRLPSRRGNTRWNSAEAACERRAKNAQLIVVGLLVLKSFATIFLLPSLQLCMDEFGWWRWWMEAVSLGVGGHSELPAIVILLPGHFQLSYGRNAPLHGKRSSLLLLLLPALDRHGSSRVFSQGHSDMGLLFPCARSMEDRNF